MIQRIGRGIWSFVRPTLARELRSLRGRLLYTLLGLFVVLLCLELWQYSSRLSNRRQLLLEGHERAAATAANMFRDTLEQIYRSQYAIGLAALSGRMSPDQVEAYLQDVRDRYDGLASLQVIGTDGVIRVASPPLGFKNSVSEQPFFRALSQETPRYLSNVVREHSGDTGLVRIASLQIGQDGNPTGIVSMEFSASALRWFVSLENLGQTEALLDGTGNLAFSTQIELARIIPRNRDFQRVTKTRVNAVVDVSLPGSEELMGYAVPIPNTSWSVAYLRPENESMAAVYEDTRTSLLALMAVIVALGIALLVILRLSLKPVVRLSAATHRLGSLDLSFRLPRAEVEEFEPLVQAFNRMAADLQASHDELLEANRRLEERVRARTRELEAEHQKVLRAERLSTLGLLSSSIAHDLRNPLNSITLNVEWLKMRLEGSVEERTQAKLASIRRELRRSDQIIRTLLAFARTGEPRFERADINDLIREVVEVNEPPEPIAVRLNLDPELHPIPVDRAQLFQVFDNLLRNAIQAMPDGGVLRVNREAQSELFRISISDTGPGIPDEIQAQVFEPLVTTKATGTGIGLALCKRIVEAHHGRIWVDSRVGEGATFLIEIPLVQGPCRVPSLPGIPTAAPLANPEPRNEPDSPEATDDLTITSTV